METRPREEILASGRARRRWRPAAAVLGAVTAACVAAALALPAATRGANPSVSAAQGTALAGEATSVHVRAEAERGRAETVFALRVSGGAGLSERYAWSDGGQVSLTDADGAQVRDSAGNDLALYAAPQGDDAETYLFALPEGASAEFDVDLRAGGASSSVASGSVEDVYAHVDALYPVDEGDGSPAGPVWDAYALDEESAGAVTGEETPEPAEQSDEQGPEPDSEPDPEPQTNSEPEVETEVETEPDPEPEPQAQTDTQADLAQTTEATDEKDPEPDAATPTDTGETPATESEPEPSEESATEPESATAPELPTITVSYGADDATSTSVVSVASGATSAEAAAAAANPTGDAQRTELSWVTEEELAERTEAQVSTMAEVPKTEVASGTISGTDVTWQVLSDDAGHYTIVVSGTGEIPDYNAGSATPWGSYGSESNPVEEIIIGDGITRIGNNAFASRYAEKLTLGSGVTRIGTRAFQYNNFESVTVPGHVTSVADFAFATNSKLTTLTFEEGVKSVGSQDVRSSSGLTMYLPSTLTSYTDHPNNGASYFVCAEGGSYRTVDGVLFRNNTLVRYPSGKSDAVYEVPEGTTEFSYYAFYGVPSIRSLSVPGTVQDAALNPPTSIEEISFADGSTLRSLNCNGCSHLQRVNWSNDGNNVTSFGANMFGSCTSLEEIVVPKGVTSVAGSAFSGCSVLQKVTWDAKSSSVSSAMSGLSFALEVGPNVDRLQSSFSNILPCVSELTFSSDNAFTIDEGALSGATSAVLSGTAYVDSNGVLYLYDAEAKTATVAYVPAGIENVQIPATITIPSEESEELSPGVTCNVTGVGGRAFASATGTKSVTFAAPGMISSIGAYAFANCTTLEQVNGRTTVEGAEKSFQNAAPGYGAFNNTALEGAAGTGDFAADMSGARYPVKVGDVSLSLSSSGKTMEEEFGSEGTGGYRLLTGDELTIRASLSSTTHSDVVYRLYVKLSSDEGVIDIEAGSDYTFTFEGVTITASCHATEDPNTVYLEFSVPSVDVTGGIPVTVNYPVHKTAGGGMTAWCVELTKEESQQKADVIVEPKGSDYLQAYWTTAPDTFALKKTASSSATVVGTDDVGEDGKPVARPNNNLTWTIDLTHDGGEEETGSAYGCDHAAGVNFTDEMTLPEGMSWDPKVLEEVRAGNVRKSGNDLYAGDIRIAALSPTPSVTFPTFTAKVNDARTPDDASDDTISFSWYFRNLNDTAEITLTKMSFHILPEAVIIDPETYVSGSEVVNTVKASVHLHYSEDQTLDASDSYELPMRAGTLSLSKTGTQAAYFGEDVTYTLDVSNTGALPFEGQGSYTLRDALWSQLYLRPASMQAILDEAVEKGCSAVITINNADLSSAAWEEVAGAEGGTAYRHSGNTDFEGVTSGHRIEVTREGSGYIAAVTGGTEATANSVEAALSAVGYGFSGDTTYTVVWTLGSEEEPFSLGGSEHLLFTLPATVKDTFLLIGTDQPSSYPSTVPISVGNEATLSGPGISQLLGRSSNVSVKREAILTQSVKRNGSTLSGGLDVKNGDVLDYTLSFTHYGSGSYENLPMVDDLYGAQYLLVPVKDNPGLVEKNLEMVTGSDGASYYKLGPGTYENVRVGVLEDTGEPLVASSITVERASDDEVSTPDGETNEYTGLHTHIEWYFSELSSADGSDYRLNVNIQTLVDASVAGNAFVVGNTVWMNNKTGQRLYATLWGGGSIVGFEKDIVAKRGETPASDELVETRNSSVGEGEEVTYRLKLSNTGDADLALPATEFADALPQTYGVFDWRVSEEGAAAPNVRVEVVCDEGVTVSGATWDDWVLAGLYDGMLEQTGQQYLMLPSGASVSIPAGGDVYLYVTLTFPEDVEDGERTWSDYASANGGGTLANTLYVYGSQTNVTHQLREPGEALLQKGVYGMSWHNMQGHVGTWNEIDERTVYGTSDGNLSYGRAVTYYVSLVNTGNKRLYVDTLYDRLPEGFSFKVLLPDARHEDRAPVSSAASQCVLVGGPANLVENPLLEEGSLNGAAVVYRSATVTASKGEDGLMYFDIAGGSGDYALKYDEEVGRYYLDRGEGIVFGYIAQAPTYSSDAPDTAINAIAMPYVDVLGTGVSVTDPDDLRVTAHVDEEHSAPANDGTRESASSSEIEGRYQFTDDDGADTWLASEVSVVRGKPAPGISKQAYQVTSAAGGETTDYGASMRPGDTLTWKITLYNGGQESLHDYVVEDVLPQPFAYEGAISIASFRSDGTQIWSSNVATFDTRDTDDDTVRILATSGAYSAASTLSFDGTERPFTRNGWDGGISLARDEGGNEVMRLHMNTYNYAVPSGGRVEICVTCRNPTTHYVQTGYTNLARLIPSQSFEGTSGQGVLEYDDEGSPASVFATAPVTVAYANATSAGKRVTEVGTDNTASTGSSGSSVIALSSAESEFRYDLEVTNSTDSAMTKLVLIDGLPDVGDHSPFEADVERGSNFAVRLADKPNFSVTVKEGDGTETPLSSQLYKVQYSEATEFTDDDWAGKESAVWVDAADWAAGGKTLADACSIRVVIEDDAGSSMPPDATVCVSFDARIEGEAEPYTVAYNSFGYHYGLENTPEELEAMTSVVGVRSPSVPRLRKELVDVDGAPYETEKETSFSFVIYEGSSVDDAQPHREVSVTVPSGASRSSWLHLDSSVMGEGWTWKAGQTYTVIEQPTADRWAFAGFEGAPPSATAYTFTYQPDEQASIVCTNRLAEWGLTLTKVDGSEGAGDAPLAGAVFALYSPDADDELDAVPDEYADLGIELEVMRGEGTDARTWYLRDVQTTSEGLLGSGRGVITWEGLTADSYALLEVRAPDGFVLPEDPWSEVARPSADSETPGQVSWTVSNTHGFEMPETGGTGTAATGAAGLALAGGAVLLARARRRRRE